MAKAVIVAVALQKRNPPPRWSYFAENPSPFLYGGKTGYKRKFDSSDWEPKISDAERGDGEVSAIYDPMDYADDPLVDINLSDEQHQISEKEEEVMSWSSTFVDKSVRANFLRKVYAILLAQMIFDAAIIATFLYISEIKQWMSVNPILLCVTSTLTLMFTCLLNSHEWLRWKYKVNVASLIILTIGKGIIAASTSCVLNTKVILLGVSVAAVVCMVFVAILSIDTQPIDFTKPLIELLFTFLTLCSVISVLIICFLSFFTIICIVAVLSVVFLFFIYIIVDTYFMLGTKNRHGITSDNATFAALSLYSDLLVMIMFITSMCYYGCCHC